MRKRLRLQENFETFCGIPKKVEAKEGKIVLRPPNSREAIMVSREIQDQSNLK